MLRPRRSEVGRVCAPVELGHVDKLVRLRDSGEGDFAGHHGVGVLDAVVDVIHYIGRFFVFDGLEEADLEEVRRPVGPVLRALVVPRLDSAGKITQKRPSSARRDPPQHATRHT